MTPRATPDSSEGKLQASAAVLSPRSTVLAASTPDG
jgi:hypothetical protein